MNNIEEMRELIVGLSEAEKMKIYKKIILALDQQHTVSQVQESSVGFLN